MQQAARIPRDSHAAEWFEPNCSTLASLLVSYMLSPFAAVCHCCTLSQCLAQQRLISWRMRNVCNLQQQQQQHRHDGKQRVHKNFKIWQLSQPLTTASQL
jgi:hypothetical protein